MRWVYIISDLHLGGRYGDSDDPNDRGFRICTHVDKLAEFVGALTPKSGVELVINGDLVDFLAEQTKADPHGRPFTQDVAAAVAKFDAIVERDRVFFDALKEFLAAGHRLVITLGNHDIELAMPEVRARLREHLGDDGSRDFRFIHDGEAYIVGDALIEHGNRYDGFNVVNFNDLRQLRSLQSRRQPIAEKWDFLAPAGSFMVADVINLIKEEYKFVDLLKPETDAVVPIIFALEPGYRKILKKVAKFQVRASKFKLDNDATPAIGGDISSSAGGGDLGDLGGDMGGIGGDISADTPQTDELDALLKEQLGDGYAEFAKSVDTGPDIGEDISTKDEINRIVGLARMLIAHDDDKVQERLPALLQALQVLRNDKTFDRGVETDEVYENAARELVKGGFKYVLFGHTHLAKDIEIDGGARYLNSGTWADLMQFPDAILSESRDDALASLGDFVGDIKTGNIAKWVKFIPTYIRLGVGDDGKVAEAGVHDYTGPDSI